jgi:hypothetical protein
VRIAEVIPKDDHLLYIKAADGQAGLFDITPFLDSEAFAPLKDRNAFEHIHNGGYYIEWDCGADLSADTIQARWKLLASEES